jgi:DnaJ-class molecular chaperone
MNGARRCFRCDGEGVTYAVFGQLDTYEECETCGGSGLTCNGGDLTNYDRARDERLEAELERREG